MRKSMTLGGLVFCGVFFAAAGCQPVKGGIVLPEPNLFPLQTDSSASVFSQSPTSTRTGIPAGQTGIDTATESILTPTPTVCSPGSGPGVNGKLFPLPTLPASASIQTIHGHTQSLPLDCESRSAVDWAGYFGRKINELEFFYKLPVSDDPNKGFVGNVRGAWGNLPPNAYGVYAGPVARLLRSYGVSAFGYRGMAWDQLRAEVAAGRPVIVWVVGHVARSTPVTMTATDGDPILAARYEHTVIFVGYDQKHAAVLDGSVRYAVPVDAFLTSWGTLGNMAVIGTALPTRPGCPGGAVELMA